MSVTEALQAFTVAAVLFGSGFVVLHYHSSRVRRMVQERERRILGSLTERMTKRMEDLAKKFGSELPGGFLVELQKFYSANMEDELRTMREEWSVATDPLDWRRQLVLYFGVSCAVVLVSGVLALTIYESYWVAGIFFALLFFIIAVYYAVRIEMSG
jgi:hypothetical protein